LKSGKYDSTENHFLLKLHDNDCNYIHRSLHSVCTCKRVYQYTLGYTVDALIDLNS